MAKQKLDRSRLVSWVSKSSRKGPRTRRQMAEKFDVSLSTIINVTTQLEQEGLLFRAGAVRSGQRGRPETLYRSS